MIFWYHTWYHNQKYDIIIVDSSYKKFRSKSIVILIISKDLISWTVAEIIQPQIENNSSESVYNVQTNNFDNGIGTFNSISLFISHNLKQGTNIEYIRNKIFPYIEQAYLEGKVDADLFYAYDNRLNQYYGYQYYGTLPDSVPLLEKETFSERKSRLKLSTTINK